MNTGRSGGKRQQGKKMCTLDRAVDVELQGRAGHSGSVAVELAEAVQDGSLNQDRSDTQQLSNYKSVARVIHSSCVGVNALLF